MRTFRYDPSKSFRGWLKTVAHGAWCDWVQSGRKQGKGSGGSGVWELLTQVEARTDLLQRLEEQYDCELLEEASARVRLRVEPHTWEAFRLLAQEGRSGAEVAKQLGMKVATVFATRSKVQKMLQEEVQRLEGTANGGE